MGKKTRNAVNTEFPLLDELNLYASNTGGDGNCLFRALSDQVYGDESHHAEIRSNVVTYVESHGDHFSAFVGEYGETFEQYIRRLYQDGVYGGHIEIVGFAEYYKRQVAIYQADNMYILAPQSVEQSKWLGTAHLAYHTWEHYSSVRPKAGPHSGPVEFPVPDAVNSERPASSNGDNGDTTVPPWKVEIVLRSVPDVSETQIVSMLRTKDLDAVIEELLVQQYEAPADQAEDSEPSRNIHEPVEPSSRVSAGATQAGDGENSGEQQLSEGAEEKATDAAADPVQSKLSKKQVAKERRLEKKERARRKKSNAVASQHISATGSGRNGSEEGQEHVGSAASRVIHI